MMNNRILQAVIAVIIACGSFCQAQADTWTVAGSVSGNDSAPGIFGTAWDASSTANRMRQHPTESAIYYIVKEVTVTEETTYAFKVVGSAEAYPASNYEMKVEAGTWTLLFYFNADTHDVNVVQAAIVSGEQAYFSTNWNENLSTDRMTFSTADLKFHLRRQITTTGDNETFQYKIATRQGNMDATNPFTSYGNYGHQNTNATKTFEVPGTYDVDFVFDPLKPGSPDVHANRYMQVNIGGYAFASFSCPFKTNVPEEVTAFYVTGESSYGGGDNVDDYTYLNTSTTRKVPATTTTPQQDTGVILEADEGTYEFYETDDAVNLSGNKLWGTGKNSYTIGTSGPNVYVFTVMLNGVVSFYQADRNGTAEQRTFPAYKAFYYAGDSAPNSREYEYFIVDFSHASSIVDHRHEGVSGSQKVYDLQGRSVNSTSKKGLYIVNGKKVAVM